MLQASRHFVVKQMYVGWYVCMYLIVAFCMPVNALVNVGMIWLCDFIESWQTDKNKQIKIRAVYMYDFPRYNSKKIMFWGVCTMLLFYAILSFSSEIPP